MDLLIRSEGDQRALAERIAKTPFKRPFYVRTDFSNHRSLAQNSKLWGALREISQQVEWFGERLSPEDWKVMFAAALRPQRTLPGIDGSVVLLGLSTSRMNKQEFSELLELIHAFAAKHDVVLTDHDLA